MKALFLAIVKSIALSFQDRKNAKKFKCHTRTCVKGWFSSCCQPSENCRSVWTDPTAGMFPEPWEKKINTQEVSFVQSVYIPLNSLNVQFNPQDKEIDKWRGAIVPVCHWVTSVCNSVTERATMQQHMVYWLIWGQINQKLTNKCQWTLPISVHLNNEDKKMKKKNKTANPIWQRDILCTKSSSGLKSRLLTVFFYVSAL